MARKATAVSEIAKEEVVDRIKSELDSLVGSSMRLRANIGRCRIIEKKGTLQETHPNLFIIKVDERDKHTRLVSYSYVDVLTKTVELSKPKSGDNIFPWIH